MLNLCSAIPHIVSITCLFLGQILTNDNFFGKFLRTKISVNNRPTQGKFLSYLSIWIDHGPREFPRTAHEN